jgi:hypothetical protein
MRKVLLAIGTLALAIGVARADWDVGDPYKMHFPQLPDPTGWILTWLHPSISWPTAGSATLQVT